MRAALSLAAKQIAGQRDSQEDSLRIVDDIPSPDDSRTLLLVMCDGMGGHTGGAVASKLVSDTVVQTFRESDGTVPRRLRVSLEKAIEAVAARILSEPRLTGMGTTLIAAVLSKGRLFWLSVGDSVLWLLRGGKLTRLNQDHSMAPVLDRMVESGWISAEEAMADPTRHHLRAAVNSNRLQMLDLPSEPFALQAGDQLILASDGVMTLREPELTSILRSTASQPSDQTLEVLFAAVKSVHNPAQDNASAILVKIDCVKLPDVSVDGIWAYVSKNKGGKSKGKISILALAAGFILVGLLAGVIFMYSR